MSPSSVLRRCIDEQNIKLTEGKHVYLKDINGYKYLDGISGAMVANLGYGNEEIIETIVNQARKLSYSHNARFTTPSQEELADKLSLLLSNKYKAYFCGSGSEVIDAAIRIQFVYHKCLGQVNKNIIIPFKDSYHGASIGALNLTGIDRIKEFYKTMFRENKCIIEDCNLENCLNPESNCLCHIGTKVDWTKVGAVIFEPISANVLGVKPREKKTIQNMNALKNDFSFLTIVDEIATGISRTGKDFSFQHYDSFDPDIICISKILGVGYTNIGCMLVKKNICEVIEQKNVNILGNTYNGNPIACAVGSKVIDILQREKYTEKNAIFGVDFVNKLKEITKNFDFVFEVRGLGLLAAFEMRNNGIIIKKEVNFLKKLFRLLIENGLIVLPGTGDYSTRGDHFLIAPAYTFNETDYIKLFEILYASLKNDKLSKLL